MRRPILPIGPCTSITQPGSAMRCITCGSSRTRFCSRLGPAARLACWLCNTLTGGTQHVRWPLSDTTTNTSRTLSFSGTASARCGCQELKSSGNTFIPAIARVECRCRPIPLKQPITGCSRVVFRMRPSTRSRRFKRTRMLLNGFTCPPGHASWRSPPASTNCL